MVFRSAFEAVEFGADRADEGGFAGLEAEDVFAADGRAPAPEYIEGYMVS